MAAFRIELLGPGTIPSLDAHAYIQRFHAQRKALTTLLENEHISRLSYQRRNGERKNVKDLLHARLQALERSMENQVHNTRVIKVYYSTLENTIKNFALRESLAILRPIPKAHLETSRSHGNADTQELREFKLFIDEFRDAITAVALQVSETEGLLSSASIRAGAVDVTGATWNAFSNMVATFGSQEDCVAIERSQGAAAKLLHVSWDQLTKMVSQLQDPSCYRALRKTLRAYLGRLATIQEGLRELDSAMLTPSPQIGMGLPVQILWKNVLQSLGKLATCKPKYKITQDEFNVMKNLWVETRRVVDQITEAGNHQAVSRNSSDIGSDTDFSDTDTVHLAQGSADASTPSTNAIESPQSIMNPTENVDTVIGVSSDPDLTIQSTGVSIRQRFRQILDLPNHDILAASGGLVAAGGLTTAAGLTASGGLAAAGGLTTAGGLAASGGLAAAGGLTTAGGLAASGGLAVAGALTRAAGLTASGGLAAAGGLTTAGGLAASGGLAAAGGLTTAAGLTVSGGLAATGGLTTAAGLTVSGGLAAAGGLTTAGGLTALGELAAAGGLTTAGGLTALGELVAAGGLTTAGGLAALGELTTAGGLSARALIAQGALTVAGVAGTVTGVTVAAGVAGLAGYWIWEGLNYKRARNTTPN